MSEEMPRQPRPRPLRRAARFVVLLALPLGLGGCLVHLPAAAPAATVGVATVPAIFFAATPAVAPPPDPPAGRYTLGAITALAANDPRAAYAVPVLGPNGRFMQIALRIDELPQPQPPAVAYELVGENGVYAALADGELGTREREGGAIYRGRGAPLRGAARTAESPPGNRRLLLSAPHNDKRRNPCGGATACAPHPRLIRI